MFELVRRLRRPEPPKPPELALVRPSTAALVGAACGPTREVEQALLFASEEEAIRFLALYACDPHDLIAPAVGLSRSLLR